MTSDAPGWEAIDARLAELYPDLEPKHYGTLHRFTLGGPDPLDGVSFYPRAAPMPHWHIVGYGMSELYAKETEDAEHSGWGCWSPTWTGLQGAEVFAARQQATGY